MKKVLYVLCIFVMLLTSACSEKKQDKIEQEEIIPTFVDLTSFKDLGDGWYAMLFVEIPKKDQNSKQLKGNFDLKHIEAVFVDVINVKYQTLDGFYVPTIDKNGKEIGQISTVMPSYVQSPKYGESMKKISDFFTAKKYTHEISLSDLKDLEAKGIRKDDLVYLYNKAITKTPVMNYKFPRKKESNLAAKKLMNGDTLQFAYLSDYVDIGVCNIEYILKDGTYLSDLVQEGKANKEQIKLQETLDQNEKTILHTQSIEQLKSLGNKELDTAFKDIAEHALGIQKAS